MTTTVGLDSERLDAVRAGFTGDFLQPDDDGYDEARRIHNGLIDRRPALIARCHGTARRPFSWGDLGTCSESSKLSEEFPNSRNRLVMIF